MPGPKKGQKMPLVWLKLKPRDRVRNNASHLVII